MKDWEENDEPEDIGEAIFDDDSNSVPFGWE